MNIRPALLVVEMSRGISFHVLRTFDFSGSESVHHNTDISPLVHEQHLNFQHFPSCLCRKMLEFSSSDMYECTTALMLKFAEAIWKSGETLVDHTTVLGLLTLEDKDNHFESVRYAIDDDKIAVVIWSDGKEEKKKELCGIESNDYFHFLAIVLFDLSEGKDYALSKQFLRDARIVIGEAGNNPSRTGKRPTSNNSLRTIPGLRLGLIWSRPKWDRFQFIAKLCITALKLVLDIVFHR